MIKVYIENDNKNITITGHAGYDEYGKDIVCSSVSSIVITTINGIIELEKDTIKYSDDNEKLIIEVIKDSDITVKLINNMILLLEQLENDYKDNIKIIRR